MAATNLTVAELVHQIARANSGPHHADGAGVVREPADDFGAPLGRLDRAALDEIRMPNPVSGSLVGFRTG